MKKTLIFGLIAATLGFSACSTEDDMILGGQAQHKGMVLNATVTQPEESRATIDNATSNWKFDFAAEDVAKVNNILHTGYYTFTNDGTNFWSMDAEPSASDATWYAYFPSEEISLAGQDGTLAGVANKFALAGATASATTGAEGLNIAMDAKVAILKIKNQKGSIDIQVKTSATDFVTGLTAKSGEAGFDVTTSTTATSLFTTTTSGTYYVAVPAGVQIAVKDGDKVIKSTKVAGLTAGKYYELTIAGTAKAVINGTEVDVPWVQLWAGGPKFAVYNVGVTDANPKSYGGYYAWGGYHDKIDDHNTGSSQLTGYNDTATRLWGKNWRMPTSAELEGLIAKCSFSWKDHCAIFTGMDGNSITLPAGGKISNGLMDSKDWTCEYWSSTPYGGEAYYLESDPSVTPVVLINQVRYYNGNRSYGYLVRAVLVEEEPTVVSNFLPGNFSVSDTKKVEFTKSNVYWDGSAFKFEAKQTDYQTSWNAEHVSHFFWTQDLAEAYGVSYNNSLVCTTSDVPFFAESKGGLEVEGTTGLYALTKDEWFYLLRSRTNASALRKFGVTIDGVANCLVIAPDDFSGTLRDSYTLFEANTLGLICLPAAGRRYGTGRFEDYGDKGYYWSSTVLYYARDYQGGYEEYFTPTSEFIADSNRSYGQSLRLVKNAQ